MATAPADVFHLPKPPTFANAEEERRHRKQRLAAAFRIFSIYQNQVGDANLSEVHPESQKWSSRSGSRAVMWPATFRPDSDPSQVEAASVF